MEQNNNILQKIGNWLENHNLSWIFPQRNESLKELGSHLLKVLALILLLFISACFRIIVLVIAALFNKVRNKSISEDITVTRYETAIKTTIYGICISILLIFSINRLYKEAKTNNVSLIEFRNRDNFIPSIEQFLPDDFFLNKVYWSIYNACIQTHTSREVVKLRKNLYVDDDFAKKLHFSRQDDFAVYLYSLKWIDDDVSEYLRDIDKMTGMNKLKDFYCRMAIDYYQKGDYYSAAEMTEHYFNIYGNNNKFVTDAKDINNKMHILNLLLQHKWALTTNRDFAIEAFSETNIFERSKGYDIDYYGEEVEDFFEIESENWNLSELCNDNPYLVDICKYFEGLTSFHKKNYIEAINFFNDCFINTTDKLLKQYCALMIIRTAFWNYDKLRDQNTLDQYRQLYLSYSIYVTIPYFLPDLERYENIVNEIINDPDFTGFEE